MPNLTLVCVYDGCINYAALCEFSSFLGEMDHLRRTPKNNGQNFPLVMAHNLWDGILFNRNKVSQ